MKRGHAARGPDDRPPAWALAVLAALAACQGPARSLGDPPAEAPARAGELVGALAARFGPTDRDPVFEALRPKLARASLAPSRIFQDPLAWTDATGVTKTVSLAGAPGTSRYRIAVRAAAPPPARPGDYRAILSLTASQGGDYAWRMHEELAVGRLGAGALSRAVGVLLASGESLPDADARSRVREELPRASAALGRLFSLDALSLSRGADGASAVTAVARLHPDWLQGELPHFARFVERYASPVRLQVRALDGAGASYWFAEARENTLTLRLRLSEGRLAPLDAPPRPRPDRLRLAIDYSTRAGLFRIGVRGLEGDLGLEATPEGRQLRVSFQKDPEWALPFLVEGLLRGSLKRPFQGEGASFGLGIEEGPGQTLLTLDYGVAVRESWIVRWLGGLVTAALAEFRAGAEEESDRFVGEALAALRQDTLGLLAAAPGEASRAP